LVAVLPKANGRKAGGGMKNEITEMWHERRLQQRVKKRSNLAFSTNKLILEGLTFVSHNDGTHLVLTKGDQHIDYWPSTGLWWIRGTKNKRRGIEKLIKYMKAAS
jgi:hypothetical protein